MMGNWKRKYKNFVVILILILLFSNYNLPVIVAELDNQIEDTNMTEITNIKSTKWLDEEKEWIKSELKKEQTENVSNKSNLSKNDSYESIIDSETAKRDLSARVERIKQRESLEAWNKHNEEVTGQNIDVIANELGADASLIQEKLDSGLTLNEVTSNTPEEKNDKTVENRVVTDKNVKVKSKKELESTIKSEVGNVDFSQENVFRAAGLPPQPEEPKLDMLKVKLDEAPYKVDLETENVSTISGSLSLTESDFTLPGRNGNGFTLTRSYDSGSSQLYDSDVKTTQTDYYAHNVIVTFNVKKEVKKYYLVYQYHVIKNKYKCSNNVFVETSADYWTAGTYNTYSSSTARDAAYSQLPAVKTSPPTPCVLDHYYVEKQYLSATSSSGFEHVNWDTDQQIFDSYDNYGEAQDVASSINDNNGQLYNTYTEGENRLIFYYSSAVVETENVGSYTNYYNQLIDSKDQKRAPLGIGWTWDIPYLTFDNGTFVHLAGGGTYKTENGFLKGYPWKDLTFESNTTVTVNGLQSAHVLKSITGNKQYFDATGNIIQITDAYGNSTQFKYAVILPYGTLLTEITDAIGNKISITYSQTQVALTMGDRAVTYIKTIVDQKEYLTEVIDELNRKTKYDYSIKSAKFDLLSTNPVTINPYALITTVTYPTGAKTVYEYETTPVLRYTSTNSVSEAYRLGSRKEVTTNPDLTTEDVNKTSFIYLSDMGSSYNQDTNFVTKMIRGQLESLYTYKKDYIDDQNPPMIYNTVVEESDLVTRRITTNTFDEIKRIPNPISTTKQYKTATSESEQITNSTTYDDFGNVLTATDPLNNIVTYAYDPVSHLRLTEKWPVSSGIYLYVEMIRNVQGDVKDYKLYQNNVSGELLKRTSYIYDSYGNVTSTTDYDTGREAVSNYEFSPTYGSSYLTKQTVLYKDVDGTQKSTFTSSTYDKLTGNMLTYTDGKGYKTEYAHDKLDRITTITNPDTSSFKICYSDVNSQLPSSCYSNSNYITTTNETGIKTKITWDSLGREIETGIFENGVYKKKTKKAYDSLSRVLWEEDPSGNRVAYTYDHWNRLIKTTNADQSYSTVLYDDVANTVVETDEENNAVLKSFDKLGRVITEKEREDGHFVLKQTTLYDAAGNITKTSDALNQATSFGYDALGQLKNVTTPLNEVFSYSYDKLGNMTQTTYPGNKKISKTYDEIGNVIRYVDEAGKEKKMYYDLNGNLSKLIDRKNAIFNYSYDSKNRLLTRTGPNDTVTYTYDTDGKRKTMSDLTGVTNYQYDSNTGLLKKKIFPDQKLISYEYDLRGNRTRVIDPFGRSTVYTYDAVNRMKTVTTDNQLSGSYEYFNNDRIKKIQHGNGQSSNYSYQNFEIAALETKQANGTVLNSYSFDYDPNGNMTKRIENTVSHTYSYDPLGRVKTNSQYHEVYEYDPRGNRTSLLSDAALTFEAANYSHDSWNRLVSYNNENKSVSYGYNGDDQLYERIENGVKKRYYWDEDRIIAEAVVNGTTVTPVASYVYGTGLLERIDANNLSRATYLLNSHQDVVELRNSNGDILNKYTYDIWGKPLTESETISNPFRYSSEYWDSASKLVYLSVRWYDPNIARFLEEDTFEGDLKNPLSLNLYSYAHNDPIAYSDPTGNFAFLIPLAIYVGKIAIKTAVDVSIDYGAAKVSGGKFNLGKAVLRNGFSNTVPGLGEAKTIGKFAKMGKVLKASRVSFKGKGKTPPNPNGKNGGAAHQKKINEIVDDIKSRGLKPVREQKYDTTGGHKNSRYADVVGVNKKGKVVEIHQVGKQNKNGTPISRERKAMDDIRNSKNYNGAPINYHPYNR